jgi:hypothetical protein
MNSIVVVIVLPIIVVIAIFIIVSIIEESFFKFRAPGDVSPPKEEPDIGEDDDR